MSPKLERPDDLPSTSTRIKTGYGNLYVTVSELDGKPFEVFAVIGRSGKSLNAKAESLGRMVSLALRYGIPVSEIVDQLSGISGERPMMSGDRMITSIPDAIAYVLDRKYAKNK